MEFMPDGRKLWDAIKKYDPTILSSPTRHPSSVEGKKKWLKENLPGVPYIIESKKEKYAEPGAILIDDREKNIKKWEDAGGIGILYKNAESTIKKLDEIMAKEKDAGALETIEDPSGRRIVVEKPRMTDTFGPQMHEKLVPPKKGKGARYKRQEGKRIDWYASENRVFVDRVVLSYLSGDFKLHSRPVVIDPYDSMVQQAVRELGPDLGHVEVIKLEPVCPGNRLAWVTNQDLIKGRPGKQRVIHLCLKKIKDKFKAQHGQQFSVVDSAQQGKMKDTIKQLLKDVVLPHEAEHVRQELEHGREFGPLAEPEAERAEEWKKLEQMGVIHK